MHIEIVEPLDRPLLRPLPHHVHVLSTLGPSCTRDCKFVDYIIEKTLYVASYVTVFKTAAYVRGFEGIFHVYPTLYVEKTLISAWAVAPILGWPRKLIR